MSFDWAPAWPAGPGFVIPHVQDVGVAVFLPIPGVNTRPWFVGSDGTLWFLDTKGFEQVASPGDLTRVAVSPDGTIWCVNSRGSLWKMLNNAWSQIDVPGEKVIDVDVCADGTVYLLMENTRYYSLISGGNPYYHGTLVRLLAIAGLARPNDANPFGIAWGVSDIFGPSGHDLAHCETINGWSPTGIGDVREISTSNGTVWMVKTNGTAWKSTDGVTQFMIGKAAGFTRIAASYDIAYAIKADGSAWVWRRIDSPSPPPPPPPPPPLDDSPPLISVGTSGGGANTVFRVTGSDFRPDVQVTVRGARIGDGQVFQFYWSTRSNGLGDIQLDIPLPCVPGVVISFSANDGRNNPNDLTNRLWSNTVQATCLPG